MSDNEHQRYAPPQAEVAAIETPIDADAPLAGAGGWIEKMNGLEERLFGVAVFLAYYLLTEVLQGRSLGKRITGTRVVTASGRAPTKGQLIKRSFARLVPFEFLSIFRAGRSMWHDDWSATRTVHVVKG